MGFCKCEPGFFGRDCGRSKAYEPVVKGKASPAHGKLKIYIYELPTWIAHEDGW